MHNMEGVIKYRTRQVAVNPHNTVFDTKRLIGRKYSDESVRQDVKLWPFKVESGAAGKPMIRVDFKFESKVFSAEEVSSMILVKMKETAEQYLGHPVKQAVITACYGPSYIFTIHAPRTYLIARLNSSPASV